MKGKRKRLLGKKVEVADFLSKIRPSWKIETLKDFVRSHPILITKYLIKSETFDLWPIDELVRDCKTRPGLVAGYLLAELRQKKWKRS